MVLTGRQVSATTLLYEISGEVVGAFQPVIGDAAADLLSVPRNQQNNTVPFSLKLTVNADATPNIVNDNSLIQTALYPDAILAAELDLNGVSFETQRPFEVLSHHTSEASLELGNRPSPQTDQLVLKIAEINSASSAAQAELFSSRTVPFNQTLGGIKYTTATISIENIVLNKLAGEFLNDINLPREGDTISSEFMNFTFLLRTALHAENQTTPRQSVMVMGALATPGSSLKFTITTVPDPDPGAPTPTPVPNPSPTDSPTAPVTGSAILDQEQSAPVLQVGETNRYTIRFTNTSSFPAVGVRLTNILPTKSKKIGKKSTQGRCSGRGRTTRCNLGTVAPGETVITEIDMAAGRVGNFENRTVIRYRMARKPGSKRKRTYSVKSRVQTTVTGGPAGR